MCKAIYIFICLLFLTSSLSYSQNSASVKNIDFGIVLTLKAGYRSSSNDGLSNPIPGGLVFDGSLEFPVAKGWFAGFSSQYWNKTDDNIDPIESTVYPVDYTGFEFAFGIKTRSTPTPLSIVFGLTVGNYSISTSSKNGEEKRNYLSLTISTGIEYFLAKNFAIGADASYKALVNFDRAAGFWVIKAGPSFNFN